MPPPAIERNAERRARAARSESRESRLASKARKGFPAGKGRPLTELLPGILSANATIVTESDKRDPLVLDLPLDDERVYGDTRIAFHYVV